MASSQNRGFAAESTVPRPIRLFVRELGGHKAVAVLVDGNMAKLSVFARRNLGRTARPSGGGTW